MADGPPKLECLNHWVKATGGDWSCFFSNHAVGATLSLPSMFFLPPFNLRRSFQRDIRLDQSPRKLFIRTAFKASALFRNHSTGTFTPTSPRTQPPESPCKFTLEFSKAFSLCFPRRQLPRQEKGTGCFFLLALCFRGP